MKKRLVALAMVVALMIPSLNVAAADCEEVTYTESSKTYDANGLEGVLPVGDGTYALFVNGAFANTYSGLYFDANYGWMLITNGFWNNAYNGLYNDAQLGWWLITGGAINFGYSDIYADPVVGSWLITGGTIDFGYTDWYTSNTVGTWYISGGMVDATKGNTVPSWTDQVYVWLPETGSKYHSKADCSGMYNPTLVRLTDAIALGYDACKRCH